MRPRAVNCPAKLALEALEDRVVPAINIVVNYSMDSVANGGSGFFQDNPAAATVMNTVAEQMGERISANLSAIAPSGIDTWTASFNSPETGNLTTVVNLNVAANTIIVYVGAHSMSGGEVGYGATGGDSWYGYSSFGNEVNNRDWSGFVADDGGIWGGSIQFATNANWYFGLNPDGIGANQVDFYSVATHELGHVLGAGTSPQWNQYVHGNEFYGPHAKAVYGGPVPLNGASDEGEWANMLTYDGQLASMGPTIPFGTRVVWTALDQAALEDVGWDNGIVVSPPAPPATVPPVSLPPVTSPPPATVPPVSLPPVSPPPVTVPPVSPPPVTSPPPATVLPLSPPPAAIPVMAVATDAGISTEVRVTYSNGSSYAFYPFGTSYRAGATVALGDVTGDGYPDIVVASGDSGTAGTIKVYDGLSHKLIAAYTPLGGFGGGLSVAVGNVTGGSHDDIVVGVLTGGCPVVEVLDGATGKIIDKFFAYSTSFLGGVRVAAGDVNGDGYADVIVAPGHGQKGLPVEVFSGKSVATGAASPQLISSFVPFAGYTGAINVAAGNLTSTAYADVVVGTQSSGEQFKVYSGVAITNELPPSAMVSQDAWSVTDNSGLTVALVPDASDNGHDDLIVADGSGARTARYTEAALTASGWSPASAELFAAIPGVNSGVHVG